MSQPLRAAAVTPVDLRRAASRFATGVALVTAPGGLALVVDSFISVSLEPPLVAFAPSRTSLTWRSMRRTGRYGISVLDAAHAGGIRERARPGADRLAGLDVELLDGVPVVRDALAALVCAIEAEHPAGDHSIVLGRVLAIRHGDERPPLVFFGGDFTTVPPPRTGSAGAKYPATAVARSRPHDSAADSGCAGAECSASLRHPGPLSAAEPGEDDERPAPCACSLPLPSGS